MPDVLTDRDGPVLRLTLNRPEVLNALTGAAHAELAAALGEAADPAVRVVVLTGAGRAFCVGQDLRDLAGADADIAALLRAHYHPTLLAMRALRVPVLAAVNGPAAGAGLGLACACDLRIASGDASFVPAFVSVGLVPDSGASWFLARILGPARAFEWLVSGRRLGAAEALGWGLVSEVVPAEAFEAAVADRAARLAAMPTRRGGADPPRPRRGHRQRPRRPARARGGASGRGVRHGGLRRGRRRLPREARATVPGPVAPGPEIPGAPGIARLPLPTPFPVGPVNCYLIEDAPLTLVDPGPATDAALQALEAGLAARGHRLEEVGLVLVTHRAPRPLRARSRRCSGARAPRSPPWPRWPPCWATTTGRLRRMPPTAAGSCAATARRRRWWRRSGRPRPGSAGWGAACGSIGCWPRGRRSGSPAAG